MATIEWADDVKPKHSTVIVTKKDGTKIELKKEILQDDDKIIPGDCIEITETTGKVMGKVMGFRSNKATGSKPVSILWDELGKVVDFFGHNELNIDEFDTIKKIDCPIQLGGSRKKRKSRKTRRRSVRRRSVRRRSTRY